MRRSENSYFYRSFAISRVGGAYLKSRVPLGFEKPDKQIAAALSVTFNTLHFTQPSIAPTYTTPTTTLAISLPALSWHR